MLSRTMIGGTNGDVPNNKIPLRIFTLVINIWLEVICDWTSAEAYTIPVTPALLMLLLWTQNHFPRKEAWKAITLTVSTSTYAQIDLCHSQSFETSISHTLTRYYKLSMSSISWSWSMYWLIVAETISWSLAQYLCYWILKWRWQ